MNLQDHSPWMMTFWWGLSCCLADCPFHHVLTWREVGDTGSTARERWRQDSLKSLLIRMLILYSNGDPTIITSSKHKYLSKALSPHTISLGLRASRWVWGNTIQSFASTHYQAQLWIIEMCQWLKQIKNYAFRLLTIHEYMYVAGGQRAEIQIDVVNNLF